MQKLKVFWQNWKSTFLVVLLILIFRSSFADQYVVPSGSMQPTIEIGDRLLVNKMSYELQIPFTDWTVLKTAEPQRGEVVVFVSPEDNSTVMVKRLIGLPGDEIEIVDGFVRVNGRPLHLSDDGMEELLPSKGEVFFRESADHSKYRVKRLPGKARAEKLHLVVPQGHYFMMGDNRDNSWDSRGWGFVPYKNLKGRVQRVIYSANLLQADPDFDFERFWLPL